MRCPHCDGTGRATKREPALGFLGVPVYGGPMRDVRAPCSHCDARGYILHAAQLQAARAELWEAVGHLCERLRLVGSWPHEGTHKWHQRQYAQHISRALRIIGEEPGRFQ